ncbi:VID27-like protein [Coregonus clupeaformis]|uniref:VID27-like protein n=1 Tax=Coregonus clupeaformis TaxID=59861 RepID=UPI001E1C8A55|nr:VID27-like protein [Coregonus clupeaformis]
MSEPSSGCGVPVQRSSQPGPETVSVKLEDCCQTLELSVIVKKEEDKGEVKEETEKREIKEEEEEGEKREVQVEEGEKREVQVEEERNADPGESSNSGSLSEPSSTSPGNHEQHRQRNSRQKHHHCMDCFT